MSKDKLRPITITQYKGADAIQSKRGFFHGWGMTYLHGNMQSVAIVESTEGRMSTEEIWKIKFEDREDDNNE